jgi:hypothetical protein
MKKIGKVGLAKVLLSISVITISSIASSPKIVSAKDPNAILSIAKGYGSAKLERDSRNDPMIVGRIDGVKYVILFYGCNKGENCDDIQFVAGWEGGKVSLKDMNRWNSDKRYGKAFIDSEGDPRLIMSVNLDDSFNWWSKALKGFVKDFIGK